jgi:hypothetical protein
MAKAADRNTLTYAYAAHPYSNATGDVPVNSLESSVSKCESPSTTTTIGFLTRDPIGIEGSAWDLYEFVRGRSLGYLDPFGALQVYGGTLTQLDPDRNRRSPLLRSNSFPGRMEELVFRGRKSVRNVQRSLFVS